mgnify:CR=1 FL=1
MIPLLTTSIKLSSLTLTIPPCPSVPSTFSNPSLRPTRIYFLRNSNNVPLATNTFFPLFIANTLKRSSGLELLPILTQISKNLNHMYFCCLLQCPSFSSPFLTVSYCYSYFFIGMLLFILTIFSASLIFSLATVKSRMILSVLVCCLPSCSLLELLVETVRELWSESKSLYALVWS